MSQTGNLAATQTCTFDLSVDVGLFIETLVSSGVPYAGFLRVESVDNVNSNFVVGPAFGRSASTLTVEFEPASVPEPSTLLLLGSGLAEIAVLTRRISG